MFGIPPILLSLLVALPVTVISLAGIRVARSARRNDLGRCGRCGGPLYAPRAWAGPSLLQGQQICERCAAKERHNLKRSLIAAAGITAVAALALAAVALWAPAELGAHPWLAPIATLVSYPLIFGGAIAWMKRANRRAAQRLGLPRDDALEASTNASRFLLADGEADGQLAEWPPDTRVQSAGQPAGRPRANEIPSVPAQPPRPPRG